MKMPVFIAALTLVLGACGPVWRSPDYMTEYGTMELKEPILTMEQYSERSREHPRPYVVTLGDSLVLFGAEHTKDPSDPQLDSIRRVWERLSPSVALVEGRLGFLFRWTTDPVEKFGESGLVHDLARQHGIPVYTWEPPIDAEVAWVLRSHSAKRTALFYILRPYFGQRKFARPDDPDGMVEGTIRRRTAWKGLEGSIASVAEIDSIWKADFPGAKDWRETDDRYGWPGYLGTIGAASNAFRDEHFARVIIHLLRNGKRVFAVCGSSHAVKLEAALRATIQ
ncbi:MAG: hypothetical protein HUU02_02690 [Bacteroidetes bacterium]|nr:hypothetical protein [Bacteroidota bacterium]